MYKLVLKLLIVATPIVLVSVACPQELTNAKANLNPTQNSAFGQGRLSPRIVPTEAYRRDVLRVMIQEANRGKGVGS